jgi:trehalose 6-phosphate synthase
VIGHDYHLYLLAEFLRRDLPQAVIEHYVHIPWPSSRYWQMIPTYIVRRICSSLCSTDILGFQSPQDCRSFLDTVEEFLPKAQVDRSEGTVIWQDQLTKVNPYPLSINVAEVQSIANSPRALEYSSRLTERCNEMNIVRIDRAEPNKNIVRGFKAFGLLLSRYPELRGRVNFLAFLVPSRTHIRQYQRYMDEIQQTVNHVNQTYGNDDWKPIQTFIENNYTQAVAAMKLYDVLLVNTIIEGMNLVAKEGPVINDRNGVLILSETSGVHHQLAKGALSVSPTDVEGTMDALYQAITMPPEKRQEMSAVLTGSIVQEDITHWISRQLEDIAKLL